MVGARRYCVFRKIREVADRRIIMPTSAIIADVAESIVAAYVNYRDSDLYLISTMEGPTESMTDSVTRPGPLKGGDWS